MTDPTCSCAVCELAAELAEERTLHQETLARANQLKKALERAIEDIGAIAVDGWDSTRWKRASEAEDRIGAALAGVPSEPATRDVQRDVEEFHRALDIPIGSSPAIRRPELRAALIEEEARETVDAILAGDLVAAIDGLCDLLCVIYGAAVEFGVELAPFWDEVHRSNMAKRGGPMRADGKRLKPEGWKPPNIAGVLAAALVAVRTPEEQT